MIRRDIVSLLFTIQKFGGKRDGIETRAKIDNDLLTFPLLSFQYIIQDYLTNGYYTEKEMHYHESSRGKINWKKTIQQIKPQMDGANPIYFSFIIRQNRVNENNIITLIHKYCVYQSFLKLGWLYTEVMPPKPPIVLNKRLFLSVIDEEIHTTFDLRKKRLFISMKNIILQAEENFGSIDNSTFGVNGFQYIWERLVDFIFGEENKVEYFPHSTWEIIDDDMFSKVNAPLEPDTILRCNDAIYIIDAKYYKYGITLNPNHLPGTASIQKQITYAEYIENLLKQKKIPPLSDNNRIFNAFVMPFDKMAPDASNYKSVSVGKADWIEYPSRKNHEYVIGILADTRHLITTFARKNAKDILELSTTIEESINKYRQAKEHTAQ